MSFAQLLQEDRRLVLLRTLAQIPGNSCNAYVLHQGLEASGYRHTLPEVKEELLWLEAAKLVVLVQDPPLIVATLTQLGLYVSQGQRRVEGVKAPLLGD